MSSLPRRPWMFPLPYIMYPILPRSRSRRVRSRYNRKFQITARANKLVRSLNSLVRNFVSESSYSVPYYSEENITKNFITKIQSRVLAAVYLNAAKYVSRLYSSLSDDEAEVTPGVLPYMKNLKNTRLDYPSLCASRVSLPKQAATASLLSLLPPAIAESYSSPSSVLLSDPPRPPKVRLLPEGTSQEDWTRLVVRMKQLNMLTFTVNPVVVNGVFVVPKDISSDRLIINAKPLNSLCVRPPRVDLPTPDVIAKLRKSLDSPLFVGKSDRDNFYHRLVIPEWLRPYLALAPVKASSVGLASSGMVFPCCITLPMGWSHSVFLAHSLHEYQIDLVGCFPLCSRVSSTADPYLDRLRHVVYIDDVGALGPDDAEAELAMDIYDAHMTAVGLPGKPSKRVKMTEQPVELLGLTVSAGAVGVAPVKLELLVARTASLLSIGSCSGLELLSLVSSWTWALLVRRQSLAVFGSVYRFVQVAVAPTKLWASVRRELDCVMGLVPVLGSSWNLPFDERVLASDASTTGFGVVTARVDPTYQFKLSLEHNAVLGDNGLLSISGLPVLLDRSWSTIVSAPVRFKAHINVLESLALLLAYSWRATLAKPCLPVRLITLLDSSVLHFALTKGRSSARPLLKVLRRISALLLATNMFPVSVWVPSECNPSDAASRVH